MKIVGDPPPVVDVADGTDGTGVRVGVADGPGPTLPAPNQFLIVCRAGLPWTSYFALFGSMLGSRPQSQPAVPANQGTVDQYSKKPSQSVFCSSQLTEAPGEIGVPQSL